MDRPFKVPIKSIFGEFVCPTSRQEIKNTIKEPNLEQSCKFFKIHIFQIEFLLEIFWFFFVNFQWIFEITRFLVIFQRRE